MKSRKVWIIAVVCLAVGAAAGDPTHGRKGFYTPHDKAYFLPDSVEFVNPGLVITVQSAAIASDGTITTTFTVADPAGLPLDTAGVNTPGPISLSFLAAEIPHGQEQYVSYITKAATGAVMASTNQPAADSGGTTTAGRARPVYLYVQDQSHRIRSHRHQYDRHLRLAQSDDLQPRNELRQHDI